MGVQYKSPAQNPPVCSFHTLCARMKLAMHSLEPLLIDMGIDLGRRYVGVAQHFLDDPQIGAVPEQMRRETVPEKMWINILFQSGVPCMFFHDLPDTRRC